MPLSTRLNDGNSDVHNPPNALSEPDARNAARFFLLRLSSMDFWARRAEEKKYSSPTNTSISFELAAETQREIAHC